jgi:hypothetical protein
VKEEKEKYSVEKLMVKKIEAVEKENLGLQSICFFFLSLFTCFFIECNFFALWRTTLTKMEIERERERDTREQRTVYLFKRKKENVRGYCGMMGNDQ